jgi:hypothetical protein
MTVRLFNRDLTPAHTSDRDAHVYGDEGQGLTIRVSRHPSHTEWSIDVSHSADGITVECNVWKAARLEEIEQRWLAVASLMCPGLFVIVADAMRLEAA